MTLKSLHHDTLFDPARPPDADALARYLGNAAPLWNAVIDIARRRAPHLAETWHFAGARVGWSSRLMDKARILVYLTPEQDRFRVGLVLGGKAISAARASGLSAAATAIIDAAPKYAEGHGVRFHVACNDDLATAAELLAVKLPGHPVRK